MKSWLSTFFLSGVNRGGPEEIRMTKGALRIPALTLSLALCMTYLTSANNLWSAPVTSPMAGSYGILLNQWPNSNTGNNTTGALLGVLNFNGAGNVTATYTKVDSDYTTTSGKATGTYSGNPDGSNTVNLTFDNGSAWTALMSVTDGGSGIQLLVTGGDPANAGQVFSGTGRIQSAQGTMPAGSYGYLLTGWPDAHNKPFVISGVLKLDGAGSANGSYTLDTGRPDAFPGTISGTYSVNPDGTGSMTLAFDIGLTGTVAIIVTDGGSGILMLASIGDQVTSGTARTQ
jgi:hypothetical protein